ncbi:MAG: arylsulfatase [Planctomycetota bacterium]
MMYADDLGLGDVGLYGGSACRIPTPHLDRLGAGGRVFHQGYATAATCTPSRLSLLTGRYPWRFERSGILAGDEALVIPPGVHTLPGLLREAGYATGIVGKWHLGLGRGDLDWNRPIAGGPLDVGFDEAFVLAATNDRVPCVYLDDDRVANLDPADPIEVSYDPDRPLTQRPIGRDAPESLSMPFSHGHDMTVVNGISRIGTMSGGESALWDDATMSDIFLERALGFIESHADRPFFLYQAFHQPHVPRVPNPRFIGATDLGPRGDVIVELDWCVGQVVAKLEALGLAENTLLIFSSDNGPVLNDGYADGAVERCGTHRPAGPLRGGKYSLYDGGTHVPFIANWPGVIEPGESDAVICQVDLFASLARLVGRPVPDGQAGDSRDLLDVVLGESEAGRDELVTEGFDGKTALRSGPWVYIPPHPGPARDENTGIELGNADQPQLYHLGEDVGQARDRAADKPEVLRRLELRWREQTGPAQRNTRHPTAASPPTHRVPGRRPRRLPPQPEASRGAT